jgi:hypothetical protein
MDNVTLRKSALDLANSSATVETQDEVIFRQKYTNYFKNPTEVETFLQLPLTQPQREALIQTLTAEKKN